MNIVFFGAGAIGCYVAAAWHAQIASADFHITLLGREKVLAPLRATPIKLTGDVMASIDDGLTFSSDPAVLRSADVIILSMKAHALSDAMDELTHHAPAGAVLISLMNGLVPVRALRQRFPDRTVLAGMVPYNVVWLSDTHLHRTGPANVAVEKHEVTQRLVAQGARIDLHDDLTSVQYGKLLLNLTNAVNALSGVSLYDMLSDRDHRRVYAASLDEALRVFDATGTQWAQVGPNSPKLARRVLTAPNWLFNLLVLRKQRLDRASMTSMASDLAAGRPTEVDTINGEILRLGQTAEIATPVNAKLTELVKAAQQSGQPPAYTGPILRQMVGR